MSLDQWVARLKMFPWPKSGYRLNWGEFRETRSLSQNALQHAIYDDVSKYLMSKGRADCTPEWIKDMLKNKFLGWVDREFTDVKSGEKTIHQVLRSTAALDKGESFTYTTAILEWASSIGCEIRLPAKCEYRELMDMQKE
jgi:hypothetical protein